LIRGLAALEPCVRVRVAKRLAGSPRVGDAIDSAANAARAAAPEALRRSIDAAIAAADELTSDDLLELGELILHRAPDRFESLALPPDAGLLCKLADVAVAASERAHALALFERLLAAPIADGEARDAFPRALEHARALEAYDVAARLADRAQPLAHDNPDLFHSVARAYAAVGEYAKAFQQVKLAFEHDGARLAQFETDDQLGPVRELPEFKALLLDWHARQEGN